MAETQTDVSQAHSSLLSHVLRSVTRFVSRRPKLTMWAVAILTCSAVALTVGLLDFKTERSDLIDPDAAFQKRWVTFTDSFGDASDIVVVVEADNPESVKQALDDLGGRLEHESDLFQNVLYKLDFHRLREKGLQYLSPAQLEEALERLAELRPVLRGRWDLLKLELLFARLHYQISQRLSSGEGDIKPLLKQAESLTDSIAGYLNDPDDFRSPWPAIVPVDDRMLVDADRATYLLNDRGTMGFLKVAPSGGADGFNGDSDAIDRLREHVAAVSTIYPSVKIGVTGIPVLENDEMRRSQTDMLKASGISFVGVALLLFLGFRGFRHPALALLMLVVGLAWSFGYTTLAVGHLNILSVSFAVILIGLGIDFGIHFLARYLELRHEGQSLRPALVDTSSTVGTGIVTAAVTTALAFFCATFTNFRGVAELGVIAGGGILLCALATFVVLPALLALADRHVAPAKLPTPFQANILRSFTSKHPVIVGLLSMVVIVAIGIQAFEFEDGRVVSRVQYDYNLLNLQAEGLESVDIQKRVFQDSENSLLFAVSVADSAEEARWLREKFESLPTVHHVEELASRLPSHSSNKTRLLIQAIHAQLKQLPRTNPTVSKPNPAAVGRAMELLLMTCRQLDDPVAIRVAKGVDGLLDRFEKLSVTNQSLFLNAYQFRVMAGLKNQLLAMASASNSEPITLSDLPPELTSRFVSPTGKWLVQVFPREEVWDIGPLTEFVKDVRSVDLEATGTPLQNYEASRQIMASYEDASLYAVVVICLVLLVDFLGDRQRLLTLLPPLIVILFAFVMMRTRRFEIDMVLLLSTYVGMVAAIAAVLDLRNLRDVLLAMLPPVVGALMMLGFLGILGVNLNPANLIVLPLVLGIGVDDGVHVVHDFRLQKGGYRTSASTINAIVLTSLTSMIGFGSMMVAAHRGLYSVGMVLVIGVGSCLFVSLVTLPAILTLVGEQPGADSVTVDYSKAVDRSSRKKSRAANVA